MHEQEKDSFVPLNVFISYAKQDKVLCDQLKMHLSPLQREKLISTWHDGQIAPGADWSREIEQHLGIASLILLLISPGFISSNQCYSSEKSLGETLHQKLFLTWKQLSNAERTSLLYAVEKLIDAFGYLSLEDRRDIIEIFMVGVIADPLDQKQTLRSSLETWLEEWFEITEEKRREEVDEFIDSLSGEDMEKEKIIEGLQNLLQDTPNIVNNRLTASLTNPNENLLSLVPSFFSSSFELFNLCQIRCRNIGPFIKRKLLRFNIQLPHVIV